MKTLILNGDWLLRKEHFKHHSIRNKVQNLRCGGIVSFFVELNTLLLKYSPQKIVVAWDGIYGGIKKYEIYPPWNIKIREKRESVLKLVQDEFQENIDDKSEDLIDIFKQKVKLQHLLENCYVRQIENNHTEAYDLIADYVLNVGQRENVIIYSRPYEYTQIVGDNVCVAYPDRTIVTKDNFNQKTGYCIENDLLIKCFSGSENGFIEGVKNVTRSKLIKYFPILSEEKVGFGYLCELCEIEKEKKKLKIFDAILGSKDILLRNSKVLNLKKPWLTKEANEEVLNLIEAPLSINRDIKEVVKYFQVDGYSEHIKQDLNDFFSSFYSLMINEREYRKAY